MVIAFTQWQQHINFVHKSAASKKKPTENNMEVTSVLYKKKLALKY